MTVRIEAWRPHLPSDESRKVTEATFTYVAIGDNRRPRPLTPAALQLSMLAGVDEMRVAQVFEDHFRIDERRQCVEPLGRIVVTIGLVGLVVFR